MNKDKKGPQKAAELTVFLDLPYGRVSQLCAELCISLRTQLPSPDSNLLMHSVYLVDNTKWLIVDGLHYVNIYILPKTVLMLISFK